MWQNNCTILAFVLTQMKDQNMISIIPSYSRLNALSKLQS